MKDDLCFHMEDVAPPYTADQKLWIAVLERMIFDYVSPCIFITSKHRRYKEKFFEELYYNLFIDDVSIGTAYWIAEHIFSDDWYETLQLIRTHVTKLKESGEKFDTRGGKLIYPRNAA